MSLAILGGELKGLKLKVGEAKLVRPTSTLLRRKLFDAMQVFEGYHFYDLCAGTGSMGIEALSRGAQSCSFYEPSKVNFKLLRDNLNLAIKRKPSLESKVELMPWKFSRFVDNLSKSQNNIYFFDPPYERHDLYEEFTQLLSSHELSGQVWIESDSIKGVLPDFIENSLGQFEKIYWQGKKFICKYYFE